MSTRNQPPPRRGRGAASNPANRFERLHVVPDGMEDEDTPTVETIFFRDQTRAILSTNTSPDIPFKYSLNPYRGCEHGCIYCYARPGHEFLGFSAGLDFESRIIVKPTAPHLLEEAFRSGKWRPQVVALSGVTDPYQPIERKLGITRKCLEVFLQFRNPVSLITKNQLVMRDVDLLGELAAQRLVHVTVSVTSLQDSVIGLMEPRTARPALRLKVIETLALNDIPVSVNVAPVVPGLTDDELPAILAACADAGAQWASYLILRLPGAVEPMVLEWLETYFPLRRKKVVNRLRELRGGKLSDNRFHHRMRGEGPYAETIKQMFKLACREHNLNQSIPSLETSSFRRPQQQASLFD